MSYVYLGDLRNTSLGQASGSPEQFEKGAAGLEATAAALRAQAAAVGGPAATAFTSQAQALETQAAQLRRVAVQRRGESTSVVPATAQVTTGPNWLMIGGIGVGVLALVGVGAWALGRSNAAAPARSTAVMAMNKGKKAKSKKFRRKAGAGGEIVLQTACGKKAGRYKCYCSICKKDQRLEYRRTSARMLREGATKKAKKVKSKKRAKR